mmetsp:Transcript_10332/g.29001  ORF Transcript_10332/g.29001 Transcript_10332/m.29001 type:complete len:217 (+) Transcript_10332:949-1599(+)
MGGTVHPADQGPARGGAGMDPQSGASRDHQLRAVLLRASASVLGRLHDVLPHGVQPHRGQSVPGPGAVQPPAVPHPGDPDADPEHHQRGHQPQAGARLPRRRGSRARPPSRGGAGGRRRHHRGWGLCVDFRGHPHAEQHQHARPGGPAGGDPGEGGQRQEHPPGVHHGGDALQERGLHRAGVQSVHGTGAVDPERDGAREHHGGPGLRRGALQRSH